MSPSNVSSTSPPWSGTTSGLIATRRSAPVLVAFGTHCAPVGAGVDAALHPASTTQTTERKPPIVIDATRPTDDGQFSRRNPTSIVQNHTHLPRSWEYVHP